MLAWVGRSAFFRPPLRCAPRRCPVDNACVVHPTRRGRVWTLRLGGAGRAVGAFPAAAVVCTEALSGGQRIALSTLQDEVGFGSCGLAERVGRSALFRPPLWCVPTALSGGQRIALSTLRDYDSVQRPRRGLDRPTPPSPRPGVGSGNVGL